MNEFNDNILALTFKDFLKEFSSLAVCLTKNWEEVHVRGKFVKIGGDDFINRNEENYSQVMSKWYYSINLEKQTNLIISLFQDEDKFKENENVENKLKEIQKNHNEINSEKIILENSIKILHRLNQYSHKSVK